MINFVLGYTLKNYKGSTKGLKRYWVINKILRYILFLSFICHTNLLTCLFYNAYFRHL